MNKQVDKTDKDFAAGSLPDSFNCVCPLTPDS